MLAAKILSFSVILFFFNYGTTAQDAVEARTKDYEDKPYKFGYSIENYLHREEEKDAAGLIHGEFGFVTGDGVYHVTGYATDENGDFKILKMQSYYVGLPGVDGPAMKKGDDGKPLPAMPMAPEKPVPTTGVIGCGSCIIPTAEPPSSFTTPPPEQPQQPADQFNQNYQDPNQYYQDPTQTYQDPNQYYQDPNQNYQDPSQTYQDPNQSYQDPNQSYQDPNQTYQDPNQSNQSVFPTFEPVLQDFGQGMPPVGVQVPNSVSSDDMLGLLYRFNYTVGFHGHQETGDQAGNKQGGYFVNGRDGYGRKFTYIANEFGYQPRITLESLSGEAVPREETEKLPEHGLKGYEFRWFYRR